MFAPQLIISGANQEVQPSVNTNGRIISWHCLIGVHVLLNNTVLFWTEQRLIFIREWCGDTYVSLNRFLLYERLPNSHFIHTGYLTIVISIFSIDHRRSKSFGGVRRQNSGCPVCDTINIQYIQPLLFIRRPPQRRQPLLFSPTLLDRLGPSPRPSSACLTRCSEKT